MAPALPPRSQKPSESASGQASQSAWSLATISTQPGLSPSSVASSILGRTSCALRAKSSIRGSATRRERYVAQVFRGVSLDSGLGGMGAACLSRSQPVCQEPSDSRRVPSFLWASASLPDPTDLPPSTSLSRLSKSESTRSGQSYGCWLAPPPQTSTPWSKVRLGQAILQPRCQASPHLPPRHLPLLPRTKGLLPGAPHT